MARRARGRATGTRTNRQVNRQDKPARFLMPAYSRPRLPSRRIRDAGVGAHILEDYNASKRPPLPSSAYSTRSSLPRRATPANKPLRGPANRRAPLRCTTRTTLRPPMRLKPLTRLGARIGTPVRPRHVLCTPPEPCALCRRQEQPMPSCRAPRARTPAEACAPPMQPRSRIYGSLPPR